jgi:hypothetical protein
MGVTTHKFVSGIADGGDATLVRPSNWNDEHSISLPVGTVVVNDAEWINLVRLPIDGTDRITLTGAARAYIFGWTDNRVYNIVGFPYRPTAPFRVPAGFAFKPMTRIIFADPVRGILEGDGEMQVFDDPGASRLTLTGRG